MVFVPDRRKRLGDFGELVAMAYLTRQGYQVLDRKWRCAAGEIDLVMQEGSALVFIEVRTRRGQAPGSAKETVTRAKQDRLIELAYTYIEACRISEHIPWRIDVVALDVNRSGRVLRIEHIRHAVAEGS